MLSRIGIVCSGVTLCAMLHAPCEFLREAEVYRVAFEKEKELTNRALKLAGIGKPKSNWELQGGIGIGRFCFRILGREIRMKFRNNHKN